jgi:hypothetical protein
MGTVKVKGIKRRKIAIARRETLNVVILLILRQDLFWIFKIPKSRTWFGKMMIIFYIVKNKVKVILNLFQDLLGLQKEKESCNPV